MTNIEDIKKIKERIEKEYLENNKKLELLSNKVFLLTSDSLKAKIILTLALSYLPFGIGVASIEHIVRNGVLPIEIVETLSIGLPALIGITGQKLVYKKLKTKETIKKFSTAKTKQEKIEEKVRYEIEEEKLINYNKSLEKALTALNSYENILQKLNSKYDINEMVTINKNIEELDNDIKMLDKLLDKNRQELDIVSTQHVLKNRFSTVRNKFNKFFTPIISSLIGGLIPTIMIDVPLLIISQTVGLNMNNFQIFAPFFAGCLTTAGYNIKKQKDSKAVFNKLNKELNDDAIDSTTMEIQDTEYYNIELEPLIDALANNKLDSTSYQVTRENKISEVEKILEEPWPEFQATKKTKEDISNHPEKYLNCDYRLREGMFYTNEEKDQYIKESLNTPLKEEQEKGKVFTKTRKTDKR